MWNGSSTRNDAQAAHTAIVSAAGRSHAGARKHHQPWRHPLLPKFKTQNPELHPKPRSQKPKLNPKGIVFHTDLPDSLLSASVFTFRHQKGEVKIMEVSHPRFDPTAVQHCDPLVRHDGNYYLEAGGLGHPHLSVYQDFSGSLGVSFKPSVYPAYYKTPATIAFHQVQRPYTLLSYNSSLDKDYQVHVIHSQNINERWNVALDYHLFSPEGVYSNSSAVDHLLDINTNYYSRDARYQLRAGAIWQRFSLGENGGLSNLDAFIFKRSKPAGLPVISSTAASLANDLTLFLSQTFNTVRQVPWYRERPVLDTTDTAQTFKYTYDTLYPSDPRVLNTGVFGLDLQLDRHKYLGPKLLSSPAYDSLLNHQFSALLFWTNDAYLDHRWHNPLKVTLGVRPYLAIVALDTSLYDSDRLTHTAIYPFARVTIAPWQWSELSILAETEPVAGEYNLDAALNVAFDSSARSRLRLHSTLKATSADDLFEIQRHVRAYTSASPLPLMKVARIEAAYRYADLIDISLAANNIQDYHYFSLDASGNILPATDGTPESLLQARIGLRLQAWDWLHFDLQQLLQHSTHDIVRVPLWASKNSLYADFHLFHRALRTQVGVDVRYHTKFHADAYDPSLGLFYRQNEAMVGDYLYADFFINLQVKRASIYVKAGHLNSFLESEAHYFTVPNYPGNPFGLFYGLTWQFFD